MVHTTPSALHTERAGNPTRADQNIHEAETIRIAFHEKSSIFVSSLRVWGTHTPPFLTLSNSLQLLTYLSHDETTLATLGDSNPTTDALRGSPNRSKQSS